MKVRRKIYFFSLVATMILVYGMLTSYNLFVIDNRAMYNDSDAVQQYQDSSSHSIQMFANPRKSHLPSKKSSSRKDIPKNQNTVERSLHFFHESKRNQHFVRYSQRYQQNDAEKATSTQKLLDEKQQLIMKEKFRQLQQHQNEYSFGSNNITDESNELRDVWYTFKQNGGFEYGNYRRTIFHKRRYSKILYFLHIHKSAGSTFCRQAYLNRVNANYNNNCNVQSDQRCCGTNDTLLEQQIYANTTHWDLVAVEQEMYDSMDAQYYDYIVSLRNSQRRYYSHWNHLMKAAIKRKEHEMHQIQKAKNRRQHNQSLLSNAFDWFDWMANTTQWNHDIITKVKEDPVHYNLTIRDDKGTLHPVGNYTKWYMGQPDNYNVRMICGVRCTKIPKYQLTKGLFNYTLERLSKFSHIIFVEDMEESFDKFAKSYGWQHNVKEQHHYKRLNATTLTKFLSKQTWDPFMSVLDDALYEFARRKYNNVSHYELWKIDSFSNQDKVDEYFREGPSRNCVNECCGICSKW